MPTSSGEHRLHPLSILFDVGLRLPRLLVPFGLLLVTAWQKGQMLLLFLVLGGLLLLPLAFAIVHWLRFRYRYDPRELVVRSGLLFRNERKIPYARIQNIDAAQNPLQRLLGVTAVYVQTGAGLAPEATLRVLPLAALHEMRAHVFAAGAPLSRAVPEESAVAAAVAAPADDGTAPTAGAQAPPARRTLLSLAPRELITAGFIENRGLVLIFGALALLDQGGFSERFLTRLFETPGSVLGDVAARFPGITGQPALRGALYFVIAFLVILLFIRLLSTVWAVVRLYGFRLERHGDDLHTEYGLLTRVTATVPLRRVQTIIVRHGVLHRLFGRCTVSVETAGGFVLDGSAPLREPIAPLLRIERLPALLQEIQPGLDLDAIDWQPVHPRTFGRLARRNAGIAAVLSAGAWLAVHGPVIGMLALLATLAAAGLLHARRRAQHLAWSLMRDSVAVRDGAYMRTLRVARYSRVQVAALHRNPFDVRIGMASVRADTAGMRGGVVIPFLANDTAERVRAELLAHASDTAFTW